MVSQLYSKSGHAFPAKVPLLVLLRKAIPISINPMITAPLRTDLLVAPVKSAPNIGKGQFIMLDRIRYTRLFLNRYFGTSGKRM